MLNQWIAALRSGKYKQGRGYLRKGDYYCCLGVFCDVIGLKSRYAPDREFDRVYEYDGETTTLPEKVKLLFDELNVDKLIGMNDCGQTFEEIATELADPTSEVFIGE